MNVPMRIVRNGNGLRQPELAGPRRDEGRFAWAGACLAFALVVLGGGQRVAAVPADPSPTTTTSPSARATASSPWAEPPFRLGNAAQPFNWSTVIGDLNRDGKPDVVVADHVAYGPAGYVYRLEFSISGQRSRAVTFESPQSAVTISVADVDHDADADIVVGVPLSGAAVGLWLNDGRGHFTAADIRRLPTAVRPVYSVATANPPGDPAAFDIGHRRTDETVPARIGTATSGACPGCPISRVGHGVRSTLLSSSSGPRAPPQRSSTRNS